mgnify:CR=1 FL=1
MNILLPGCAGFIGSHPFEKLLKEGHMVAGVDNFDPFYSRAIKNQNLSGLSSENFELIDLHYLQQNYYYLRHHHLPCHCPRDL